MIEMRDVAFAYPRGGALFKGLTLSLPRGSFHFLTGPSGAGKTTFLRLCIADLLPSAGQMTLFGEDAATLGRDAIAGVRRRIGVVHQDTQFLDHLPVAENIALPMMVAGQPIDMQAIRDLLAWVQMTGQARAMPPSLSGGERQRAALARAVILSPEVILADEPTAAADREMALRLLTLLIELNRMGKTVVIATHDLALV
ncbi:MAG: cell division protein FtsE, partial [Kocuria rhizophila]